jgi:hypothetical protein
VADGEAGLLDRPSTPHRQPLRTAEGRVQAIAALRRLRMTGAQIAELLGMPLSTVSGILTRIGLGRLSRLEPPEPPNRYERRHAGELIHIDVKKLGRIQRGAGHRVTGNRGPGQRARGAGWSTSTSRSTTPPGWPTSRCSTTNRPRPRSASCGARWRSIAATGSACSA